MLLKLILKYKDEDGVMWRIIFDYKDDEIANTLRIGGF